MEEIKYYSNQKMIDYIQQLSINHTSKKLEMNALLDKYDALSEELVEIEQKALEANKILKSRMG